MSVSDSPLVASNPRWTVYDARTVRKIPQLESLDPDLVDDIELAARVFPFKVNDYVLQELIDWSDPLRDPIFRLVFPRSAMLPEIWRERLRVMVTAKAPLHLMDREIREIRLQMNPDPSGQATNVPVVGDNHLQGIQHKYPDTVLAFPAQGQTCHSYCSFCFRWPQFTDGVVPRHELRDVQALHEYLRLHGEVSDLLITGGDPFVMSARRLRDLMLPLLSPELSHVRTIRIGTKALTYWPFRILNGDGAALLDAIRELSNAGKQVAIMAHVNHWREMEPEPFRDAVRALRDAGAVIRTQSPILRGINDAALIWQRTWADQLTLGMVPYYMFVERDTGAAPYFQLPLARALSLYQSAVSGLSGLARTARGPVMSTSAGKLHVVGTLEMGSDKYFVLNFLRAREQTMVDRPFLAHFDEEAVWVNDLRPAPGFEHFLPESLLYDDPSGHTAGSRVLPGKDPDGVMRSAAAL